MKYFYDVTFDNMMNYQELLFLSNMSPSIKDSIKRWERIVFILLVLLLPLIFFLVFTNLLLYIIVLSITSILYMFFRKKATLYFWKSYKPKAKKDLISTYFNDSLEKTIPYTLQVFTNKLEIGSIMGTKQFKREDIILKTITENYIFFYTINHESSYIPLDKLSSDKELIISWFSLEKN